MQVVPDTQNGSERQRRDQAVRYWRGAGGAGEAEPPAPAAVTQRHTYSVGAEEAMDRHGTGLRGTCGARAALHTPDLQLRDRARAKGREGRGERRDSAQSAARWRARYCSERKPKRKETQPFATTRFS